MTRDEYLRTAEWMDLLNDLDWYSMPRYWDEEHLAALRAECTRRREAGNLDPS